jgi:N-acetylglucosaminyldiphosphoundecaprenol N-acetyl-beta-D-mannosaminyltransferase
MNILNNLENRNVKKPTTFVSILTIKNLIKSGLNLESLNLFLDGNTLALLYRIKYGVKIRKHNFDTSGIALEMINYFGKRGRVLFFGGTVSEAKTAEIKLKTIFKNFQKNLFVINGYGNLEYMLKEIERINPSCVIFSIGSPYQEIISIQANDKLQGNIQFFTSGAFISQLANSSNHVYYPNLIIKLNIRWVYRCFKERKHIKRIMAGILTIPFAFKHI